MKKQFHSEVDRLGWLINTIKRRVSLTPKIRLKDPQDVEPMVICGTLLRLAIAYAKGIHILIKMDLCDATLPIQRSLLELWTDFKYLIRKGSMLQNCQKLQINSALEMIEFFDELDNKHLNALKLAGLKKTLNNWETEHPDLYQEVKTQRNNRKFHWSGYNRTKLHKEVGGDCAVRIYKILSMEIHGVLTPLFDFDISLSMLNHKIIFKSFRTTVEAAEQSAFRTSGIHFYFWNEYANTFGLRPIKPPNYTNGFTLQL